MVVGVVEESIDGVGAHPPGGGFVGGDGSQEEEK